MRISCQQAALTVDARPAAFSLGFGRKKCRAVVGTVRIMKFMGLNRFAGPAKHRIFLCCQCHVTKPLQPRGHMRYAGNASYARIGFRIIAKRLQHIHKAAAFGKTRTTLADRLKNLPFHRMVGCPDFGI